MSAILELAEYLGIESSYYDIWGNQIFATDETRSSLLNAMGFTINTDEDAQQALLKLQRDKWSSPLDPVYIIPAEAQTGRIRIRLAASALQQKIHLLLSLENGDLHQKQISVSQLKPLSEQTIDGQTVAEFELEIPDNLTLGYHMLDLRLPDCQSLSTLVVAPRTCYEPKQVSDNKLWGVAAQLYSLRSQQNLGLGDFGDLAKLVHNAAEHGASSVGLNPLHPLFPANPAHISPYSPTSRSFVNTLYIDVHAISELNESKAGRELLESGHYKEKVAQLNQQELLDYPAVAKLKQQLLEIAYQHFVCEHQTKNTHRSQKFDDFCDEMGAELDTLCTYDALYEHFHKQNPDVYGWKDWPAEYQQANSAAVIQFAQENKQRIGFFKYCQWIADQQLSGIAKLAKQQGMPVGLYLDLAVGCDGSGAEVWGEQDLFVPGAGVGCPPDLLNQLGQDWGLTPINPFALRQKAFRPFVNALRNNMRHAGALRIDHVFGLMRQYWIAPGKDARSGAYVRFPLDDLLRIIALESRRQKCLVIGEDLGTTPDGFGDIAAQAKMLSYKVLYFENQQDGRYVKPADYPDLSMVTVSTHDLPTIKGWWEGNDLKWRTELKLYPSEETRLKELNGRNEERKLLLTALLDAELITPEAASKIDLTSPSMTLELSVAIQKFLASSCGFLFMIPLEDLLSLKEQVNIPGTTWQHPNWLRRLPCPIDKLFSQAHAQQVVKAVNQLRVK
ncbi:4-alpha-glucanotransferase [Catenovulum sediminis]|uniref:4-alpha-glucanotransferase n=1 Tax=Catenovulum sediminis TaxID=1740262 RepID=A0ABV1RNA3_9ALTE